MRMVSPFCPRTRTFSQPAMFWPTSTMFPFTDSGRICCRTFIPDIICRREEGGLSEQQQERNRLEINNYLHELLPYGVYQDYATLAKLDKTSMYRLFDICDDQKAKRILILCIRFIYRIWK